jgi:hypothetical protein
MNTIRIWVNPFKLAVLGVVMLFCFRSEAKSWLLADKNIEVRFDDQAVRLSVNDKRCNKVWEQTPFDDQYSVEKTVQSGNTLNIKFSGKLPFEAVVSLNESSAMEKMLGGVHIYVWDKAREVDFARVLKSSGIEKALILWDANHTPYPEPGYDTKMKELGYATGGYELFTDLKTRDTTAYEVDQHGQLRFAHTVYPGKFNQLAARKSDGKTYFNQFGHTSCPVAIRPEIYRKVEAKLKEFPHETFFLDVYTPNGLFECYSKEHPLTRGQFVEAVIENHRIIEDQYHVYLGGEWGAEFANAHVAYVHGMMTLQRTW